MPGAGLAVCDGLRVPVSYLDTAVLDGIQKRLERILDREVLSQRLVELLQGSVPGVPVEALQEQLNRVRRKISRLIDALASVPDDLPSVRSTLSALEREREPLERQLEPVRVERPPGGQAALEDTIEQLLDSLQSFREVLKVGSPAEQATDRPQLPDRSACPESRGAGDPALVSPAPQRFSYVGGAEGGRV